MDSSTTLQQFENLTQSSNYAWHTDSNQPIQKNKSARAPPRRLNTTKFLNLEIISSDLNKPVNNLAETFA